MVRSAPSYRVSWSCRGRRSILGYSRYMAVGRARAAVDAGDRLSWSHLARGLCRPDRRIPARPRRDGICRRPERRDQISLGPWPVRSIAGAGSRSGRPTGECDCRLGHTRFRHGSQSRDSTIPIVFVTGGDPVDLGIVRSLNRPAGNATGVYMLTVALEPKRLELIHELVPDAADIGIIAEPDSPDTVEQMKSLSTAASSLGRRLKTMNVSGENDIEPALAAMAEQRIAAAVVTSFACLSATAAKVRCAGRTLCHSDGVFRARLCRSRRTDKLRYELSRCLSPRQHLLRPHSQGRYACRPASRAVGQGRVGRQSQDCQGARHHRAVVATRPRRRGHRVGIFLLQCMRQLVADSVEKVRSCEECKFFGGTGGFVRNLYGAPHD